MIETFSQFFLRTLTSKLPNNTLIEQQKNLPFTVSSLKATWNWRRLILTY